MGFLSDLRNNLIFKFIHNFVEAVLFNREGKMIMKLTPSGQ